MPVYIPELPGLHKNQKEVSKSDARWKILCAGRRFGKTRLGIHMCMEVALNGGRAWWIAPTFAIARVGWRALENAAYSFPPEIQPKVSLANMEVTFPNGGSISCKSADNPQRLRGEGLDFLVMDEAAFIKPDVWQEVLRPTLTERKGSALFISTPMGMNNWFFDLWETAGNSPNWERFQYSTYDNPAIDPEEIDSAKDEVGSIVFAQEYLAEFVDAGQGMLKPEWMQYFQVQDRMYKGGGSQWQPEEMVHFGAADLAVTTNTQSDYTVVISYAMSPDMKLYVEDMQRIKIEGPDIIPMINNMYKKYRWAYVCMEKQGFTKTFIQEAQRRGMRVREMDASKDKITQAMPLSARMEAGDVLFRSNASWLEDLERELMTFPVGRNDDIVDALVLGVQALVQRRSWQAY
jgi:predicted phage terminase large subunit-like protein